MVKTIFVALLSTLQIAHFNCFHRSLILFIFTLKFQHKTVISALLHLDILKIKEKMINMFQIRQDIYSYFSETTVHGFRYVVEGRNIVEKMFWIIVIAIGFIISSFIVFKSFSDWEKTPLQTTIDKVSLPIEDLNFPAITVCNPSELQMPRRNRWMFLEKLLNWIDVKYGKIINVLAATLCNFGFRIIFLVFPIFNSTSYSLLRV